MHLACFAFTTYNCHFSVSGKDTLPSLDAESDCLLEYRKVSQGSWSRTHSDNHSLKRLFRIRSRGRLEIVGSNAHGGRRKPLLLHRWTVRQRSRESDGGCIKSLCETVRQHREGGDERGGCRLIKFDIHALGYSIALEVCIIVCLPMSRSTPLISAQPALAIDQPRARFPPIYSDRA